MAFKFITVSEQDILGSRGGPEMMDAINYDGESDQLITGRPGSGKTTVTLMRARKLALLGKAVLLITKHNLLLYSLNNNDPDTKATILGVYEWFSSTYSKEWLSHYHDGPSLRKRMESGPRYTEVLIDEGQDLPEFFYEAIPVITDRLLVGADTAQRVYANGANAQAIERVLTTQGRDVLPTELEYNYRNHFETYDFAHQFVPDFTVAHSATILENTTKGRGGHDYLPRVIQASDRITELLNILEENSLANVAIVVPKVADVTYYYNQLKSRGIACSMYHHNLTPTERWSVANEMESVLVTTYLSVKGLEFQTVIMPDMERALTITDQLTRSHYYVSCTRATERLYLLYQGVLAPSCLNGFRADSFRHTRLEEPRQSAKLPTPPPLPPADEPIF